MRSDADHRAVLALVAEGVNDSEISRRTGIPRATVRGWRTGSQRRGPRTSAYDRRRLPGEPYAYLLGLYLGDGYLASFPRGVYRLVIAIDVRHTEIQRRCADAITQVMPANPVAMTPRPGCVAIGSYSKHWPALFPQHGAGRKHERPIVLADWQQEIVDGHPRRFLRGLIESDGSRFVNRVTVGGRTYAYPRYTFTNQSADIRRLVTDICDRLGIAWRQMNATNVSVARRAAVAELDAFVGPKG